MTEQLDYANSHQKEAWLLAITDDITLTLVNQRTAF